MRAGSAARFSQNIGEKFRQPSRIGTANEQGGNRQDSNPETNSIVMMSVPLTVRPHSSGPTDPDEWCRQTMRSRIEPMKKIARSLPTHRELILNYFRAQKLLSSGIVEGLNNRAKVTMRKSYGFRTYRALELALYHSLGKLPEPESTHDFF